MSTFAARFAAPKSSNLVIGRCLDCRRSVRTEIVQNPADPYARIGHIGRIGGCLVSNKERWYIGCSRFPGGCNGQIEFKRVHHQVRKAAPTKCGGSCRGAFGPNCDCECGGDNHGAAHHGG
jgi:hypothetical protein